MREIDKVAEDLFDKIRSRFENVSVGDEKAKSTNEPSKARFFNFDFVSKDGTNFGNVTVSLIDENNLKIYFSKKLSTELDDEQRREWYDFLKNLRNFARRNMLSFDTRDINKSNLQLRDVEQVSQSNSTVEKDDIKLGESRLYGTSRSSYQSVGPVKLVIRHNDNIDETAHGSRTRNIEAIFVETHMGERFRMPFVKLAPARAMARHISNGGAIHDDLGQHIVEMVTEMDDLRVFVRSMRNRTFEDAETSGMVSASIERYSQLYEQLRIMRGQRGYQKFKENFQPSDMIVEDDFDIDQLRERFVKKIFDDRLSEALPYVYRAYKNKQKAMENSYISEFENWTTRVSEGTWATPEQDEDKDELRRLMEKPIEAGTNGQGASALLDDLIGSDDLNDEFYEASKSETGAETDVRPYIIEWLKAHGFPELGAEFEQQMAQQQPNADAAEPNANQLTPQANQPGPESPPPVNQPTPGMQPAAESIDALRRLAGLV